MGRLEDLIIQLRKQFDTERIRKEELDILNREASPAKRDALVDVYQRAIDEMKPRLEKTLQDLLQYPPHHDRHLSKLAGFHDGNPDAFEKSIFIMTKFPKQPNDAEATDADRKLDDVIHTVEDAIRASPGGWIPRIADSRNPHYHALLWDDIELYLLGCARGVAIVEDMYLPELNPNVALEWGWMRGMGRDVLYLQEKSFKHARADFQGFRLATFSGRNPRKV